MDGAPARRSPAPSVVVAGHICLDIIPARTPDHGHFGSLRSGSLELVGPAMLSVGGCVGNTGLALHRLGVATTLVARIGNDPLGDVLHDLVVESVPRHAARLLRVPGEATSYSLVFNRPDADRSIEHFTGVNDTFVADDVPADAIGSSTLLHVGYPPLMAALVADDGRELERLLTRAHDAGIITSLDMANANIRETGGSDRWRRLLARVLPQVDVFLPSLGEAARLLGRRVRRSPAGEAGRPDLASVGRLADELVSMGAAIAGVKLGEHGLYLRTGSARRLPPSLAARDAWVARELHSTVFNASVAGTVGAGDATIAGFLFATLGGRSPEDAVTVACAVGASSVERPDGTSGVPAWPDVDRRLRRGWRRNVPTAAPGWVATSDPGLRLGPHDRATPRTGRRGRL